MLEEAFVLSFKNTNEISTYNALERIYSKWDWRFHEEVLKWEKKAESEINAKPLEVTMEQKLKELETCIANMRELLEKELEEKVQFRAQWEKTFKIKLDVALKELKANAEVHLSEWLQYKNIVSIFEKERKRNDKYFKLRVIHHTETVMQTLEEIFQYSEDGKKFEKDHIKFITRRNLFDAKRLTEIDLVHGCSLKDVCSHFEINKTQSFELNLSKIVTNRAVFPPEKLKVVLGVMTEKDYERDFENIWIDMISQFPINLPQKMLHIEFEVERVLEKFVERKGLQLVAQLRRRSLLEWGSDFGQIHSILKEKKHYITVRRASSVNPDMKDRSSDPCLHARKLTVSICSEVKSYLQNIASLNTCFNSFFARELLELVDSKLSNGISNLANFMRFTQEYRLSMYLIACGYSIPEFELMARLYEERRNPVRYLEKHEKNAYFISFKRHYEQTQAEWNIAEITFNKINKVMKTHIQKVLGNEVARKINLPSKLEFKIKVLTDMFNSSSCLEYIKDPLVYLKQKIRIYFIDNCNEKLPNGSTRLQRVAQELIDRFTKDLYHVAITVNESNPEALFAKLCDHLNLMCESEVINPKSLLGGHNLELMDLDDFRDKIANGILMLKEKLEKQFSFVSCSRVMQCWEKSPHELLEPLLDCTEQCPLCGELCDLEKEHNGEHQTCLHCYAGWREKLTTVKQVDFCPILVKNREYFYTLDGKSHCGDKYKDFFPEWNIQVSSDDNAEASFLYWRAFVNKRQQQLLNGDIKLPKNIKSKQFKIEWSTVEKELKKLIPCI